jgi:hypothetical protein
MESRPPLIVMPLLVALGALLLAVLIVLARPPAGSAEANIDCATSPATPADDDVIGPALKSAVWM